MKDKLLSSFDEYMFQILGMRFEPKIFDAHSTLPIYLQEDYFVSEILLLGLPYLLVYTKSHKEMSPANLKKQLDKILEKTNIPVIYLAERVDSSTRRRWIEQNIDFIVPGNQMYVPTAGVDLRQYFLGGKQKKTTISPSAQALILYAIANQDYQEYTTKDLTKHSGYSIMTLNRVFDELVEFGLADAKYHKRENILTFNCIGKSLWEKALPLLKSPVRKRVWAIRMTQHEFVCKLAGVSALAEQTMLADDKLPTYAMSNAEYKTAVANQSIKIMPDNWNSDMQIEIWHYSPGIVSRTNVVDSLSLYLSLQLELDARIKSELNRLMERVAW
jgi:DNA-binding MarR family transcriptional regulator